MGGLMACSKVALAKRACPLTGVAWAGRAWGGDTAAGEDNTEWQMPQAAHGVLWWLPAQPGAEGVVLVQCSVPGGMSAAACRLEPMSCISPEWLSAGVCWPAWGAAWGCAVPALDMCGTTSGRLPMAMASPSRPRRVSSKIMSRGRTRRIEVNDARAKEKFLVLGFCTVSGDCPTGLLSGQSSINRTSAHPGAVT